jgi:hypothetical protein
MVRPALKGTPYHGRKAPRLGAATRGGGSPFSLEGKEPRADGSSQAALKIQRHGMSQASGSLGTAYAS